MTQKMTVTPYVDLTSRMTGDTCAWQWEVETVYVNGVSTAFSWSDGVLTITGYTTGVVLADFTLYLIYDDTSRYLPFDPTDSDSSPVYWENRLTGFFSVSSTIKSFETGLTEVSGGSISIRIDDDWMDLMTELVIFSNRTIRIYTDDVLVYKGITTKMDVSDYALTIQIQKRQTIMESECHWGDPTYLNKISRSNNDAYYNGANIPDDYEGFAIPMLFGSQTPYEQQSTNEADVGDPIGFFLIQPSTKVTVKGISTSSYCVKVIPTGPGSGIIGRMPSWQSISSVPVNTTLTSTAHIFERYEQTRTPYVVSSMIEGEVCVLVRTTAPSKINSARLYGKGGTSAISGFFELGLSDPVGDNYETINSCDQNFHFFPSAIPNSNWTTGAILSSTLTPAGHRFLTISGLTGIDLKEDDLYLVITSVTGARTAPEVLKFAMETHGYTVDASSFAALTADFPYTTIQQCGLGTSVPTLGAFVSEINRSLMTVMVFPASNDEPFLIKIDPDQAVSETIAEYQIQEKSLRFGHEYRDQVKSVEFRPKYAKSDEQKTALFSRLNSSMATLFAAERTIGIEHVLTEVPTARWQVMTELYGSPTSTISFVLLDDDVSVELADCVQIDHPACSKKIIVTQITTLPVGRQIQGRYLYVNNNS